LTSKSKAWSNIGNNVKVYFLILLLVVLFVGCKILEQTNLL
jgi:hypothetical protein